MSSSSPANVAIMSASARRFLSKALHNRSVAPPDNTLIEPQRTFGVSIQRERLVLPHNTSYIQMCIFDIQNKTPLGVPQRFRVSETGEVSSDAFIEYFVRAQHADRVFLVLELIRVNEDPNPDRPFTEEAIAFGYFPLGMKAEGAASKKEAPVIDIALSQGGASTYFCSASGFRPNDIIKKSTMGGVAVAAWICDGGLKPETRPSDFIFPPHRFISSEVVNPSIISGRVPLHVMKVSVDSFSVRHGDGRSSGAENQSAAVSNATWSLALLTHSGYKSCSSITNANLFPYEGISNTFRLSGPVTVDHDTPIHETSHLVMLLRRQTPTGPEAVAVATLPLCPRVNTVRDATVRVNLVPFMNGPFYPLSSAAPETFRPGEFVSPPLDKSKMFSRSEWACSLMLRIENTPTPAPPKKSIASKNVTRRRRQPLGQRSQNEQQQQLQALQQQSTEQQLQNMNNNNNNMLQSFEQGGIVPSPKAPSRPKKARPTKQLPIPSIQDFSEDPTVMQATPEAKQQFFAMNNNNQQSQQQQYFGSNRSGGNNSNVSMEHFQQQLATMKEELFNYLKQISQEVGTVRGEVNQVSKLTKDQQQQQQKMSLNSHEDPSSPGAARNFGSEQGTAGALVVSGSRRRQQNQQGVRVADVPLSRSQTALASKLRMIILDRQQPIRHPITKQPLAAETVLCSQHLNETRFCIRLNGITLKANAPPSSFGSSDETQQQNNNNKQPPRKFAFRIHSGLTVQKITDAGLMISEAPLPALTGSVCATSGSGETLYSLRLDPEDASAFAAVHNNNNKNKNSPAELAAAQSGHWLEPLEGLESVTNTTAMMTTKQNQPIYDHIQLASVIPQYIRKLRKERQALLFSSTPAAVTIEVLDGYSRFTIGYASLPIDAFDRPATTTHTMKEEDLLIRSEAAFWRDATGEQDGNVLQVSNSINSNSNSVCPLHKPVIGVLHLTACAIGFQAVDPPGGAHVRHASSCSSLGEAGAASSSSGRNSPSNNTNNLLLQSCDSSARNVIREGSSDNHLVSSGRLGVVEVPKLGQVLEPSPSQSLDSARLFKRSASNNNTNNNQQTQSLKQTTQPGHKPIPPHLRSGDDGSSFLTSARLSHLHAKRVEILKQTLLSSSSSSSPRASGSSMMLGGGSGSANADDRMALEYQSRIIDRQREERKQDRIQDALFKRMTLETAVVCPSGRPAIADFRFTNPYPATMAFTLEFVKPIDPSTLVTVEAAGTFGHSFICAPLEEKVIQICVRSKYSATPKTAGADNPQCIGRVRVLDDKGEVVKVLVAAATVLPPQVDRVLNLYGGTGSTISKDIFVRCFDQALVVSAEKGEIGLSKLNNIVQRLCCYVRCSGDEVNMVRKATTGASIQYLYDGAVAAWEELYLSVNVPTVPSTAFLHIFADEHQQNCLMTWALRVTPVQVFDSQPILCGQINTVTLPLPGMRSVFCTNGGNNSISVSSSIVTAQQNPQQPPSTLVQLKARPLQPHLYSVLVHAAESTQAAQAGRIVISECRIQARLPAPTFAKTIHVPPSTVPLFLRVVVRNDDTSKMHQQQRAFRVTTNFEAFVSVKPSVFVLGHGDQMPVSISVAVAAMASGRSGTQVTKYPIRLTVTDNDDKITDVFQIELIVDPNAAPIEDVSSRR